ncbi:hypothetical protein ACTFIR_005503 [Dictyostelium discoideum]
MEVQEKDLKLLLFLVIGTNDLELVKFLNHTYNNINNNNNNSKDLNSIISGNNNKKGELNNDFIENYIESTEMLEYCFYNFNNLFQAPNNQLLFAFNNLNLLKCYKNLLSITTTTKTTDLKSNQCLIEFNEFSYNNNYNNNNNNYKESIESFSNLLKIIKFIITNRESFKLNINIFKFIKVPKNCSELLFDKLVLPDLQFIIKNTTQDSFSFNPNDLFSKTYQIIKFLDWFVIENKLSINRCLFNFNIIKPISTIGSSGDLISLESYVQNYLKKEKEENEKDDDDDDEMIFKNNLISILQGASINGQINVFYHLFYNHPNLLIKKSKKFKNNNNNNGMLFNFNDFWFIFYYAIQKENLHILEFIIQVLNYSKFNQFQNYYNQHPLVTKLFNKVK